jgi:hypothetical protein
VNGLNWTWIVFLAVVPLPVACLLAYPLWSRRETILGSIVGATVIFSAALVAILREYAEVNRIVQACIDAGTACWPEPSAFTRYAIYAFIGLAAVFGLFLVSIQVESRIRNREYAPEWR